MAGDGPERTADGRWIVVDGRRWRATDPGIPEVFRKEMVAVLMDGRRGVAAARRAGDADSEAVARSRVHHAKVALGERGVKWWEEPSEAERRERLEAAVLTLADGRAPDKTTCPSDAARAVGGEAWRDSMDLVREVARELALAGEVEVRQKGKPVDPAGPWKGPIRIARLPAD